MQKAANCRFLNNDATVTLRAGRLWDIVPGEIASVKVGKRWVYGGNPYISGTIESKRLDVKALRLVPLGLEACGRWDPAEEYWADSGENAVESDAGEQQGESGDFVRVSIGFDLPAFLRALTEAAKSMVAMEKGIASSRSRFRKTRSCSRVPGGVNPSGNFK